MRMRLGLLLGAGVGYVLGTKAGTQRYEEIKSFTQRVMDKPEVQQVKQKVAEITGKASTIRLDELRDEPAIQEPYAAASGFADTQ